jgi:hypothetical protein
MCINMLQATMQHLIKEGNELYPSSSNYIRNNLLNKEDLLLTPTLKIVPVVTIPRFIKTHTDSISILVGEFLYIQSQVLWSGENSVSHWNTSLGYIIIIIIIIIII